MKITTQIIALLIALLSTHQAHAQYIQLTCTVFEENTPAASQSSQLILTFDTTLPPTPAPSNSLIFFPTFGSLNTNQSLSSTSPFPQTTQPINLDFAQIRYFPNNNTLIITAGDGPSTISLTITDLPQAFNPTMTSLPDNPIDWTPNPQTTTFNAFLAPFNNNISWNQNNGFTGGTITYTPIIVGNPTPACSPADLNQDGQLNFFDVSEFLAIFGMGCP